MPDIGAFYTLTIKRQLPGISDALIADVEILKVLKDKGRFSFGKGGDNFQIRVRSSRSTIGGSTTDWGEAGAQTTQPFTTLTGRYRPYAWRLVINKFQIQRNENAGPEAKMADLVQEQLNELKQAATHRVGQHCYGDGSTLSAGDATGSTPIDGLQSIIDDDNTYMGVARSSNSYWQGQVNSVTDYHLDDDNDGVTNGLNAMRVMWQDCSGGKQSGASIGADVAVAKDMPDYIITDAAGFRKYQNSLTPQDRYTSDTDDPEKKLAFHSAPITWDTLSTASSFWFLNTKHLHFDVVGSKMLELLQEQEISSPLAKTWTIGFQGQFYTKNPRYLGRLTYT